MQRPPSPAPQLSARFHCRLVVAILKLQVLTRRRCLLDLRSCGELFPLRGASSPAGSLFPGRTKRRCLLDLRSCEELFPLPCGCASRPLPFNS